ncbi:hypothetical protein IEO21_09917 [Rhodonia placenta]|uniref:Aldehyde dehydrogenase n=1 Tax=Rhodonia placenta TaxID=104341 RepID=A0A8H7NTI9_9APHY|nr:hypothetical protein IEO21_09917 [Postia placenta]
MSCTPLEEIPKVYEGLKAAFRSGKTKPVAFRKAQLSQLLYLLDDNVGRFQQALHADLGRPFKEAQLLEINGTLLQLQGAHDNVEAWAAPQRAPFSLLWYPMSPITRKEPKGVVLIIGPFNYPVYLILCPLAAAIAAGNTVLLKPSELSMATATLLTELIPQYLDPDVVRVVNGAIPETTKILELPFDHILYTGNGCVGRIVSTAAAQHLTPVTLECSGKCPCVIDPKCDLKTAAKRIMWGKLANGGQICLCPDYVIVPAHFQDAVVEALVAAYKELHPIDPRESGEVTRMVNKRHAERIKKLVDTTRGTIVIGGEVDTETLYAAPTIVRDVGPKDSLMSEELFGPVLPIVPVSDVDEAIAFIGERDHPLCLYIFSNDAAFKTKVIDNTLSGTVAINDTLLQIGAPTPFGGVGASGHGGYQSGKYAFETFTHMRPVTDSPNWLDSALMGARYTPYDESSFRQLNAVLHARLPPRNAASLGFFGRMAAEVSCSVNWYRRFWSERPNGPA